MASTSSDARPGKIGREESRGPFPWAALISILSVLSELAGCVILGFVAFLVWEPLPLVLLGLLLIYLPNRPIKRRR